MTAIEMINQLIKDLEELKESPSEAVTEMLFDGLDEGFIVAKVNEIDGYAEVRERYRADVNKFEELMEKDESLMPLFEAYRSCLSDEAELIECHQFRMGFGAAVKLMVDGLDCHK